MYLFKIHSIEKTISWINGVDSCIDFPESSTFPNERVCLQLIGWISSKFSKIEGVYLTWRGHRVAEAKIFDRPDVDDVYPKCSNYGFQLDFIPATLGDYEPLKVAIKTEDGRSSSLFEIHLNHASKNHIAETEPTDRQKQDYAILPIVSLARSGTTHLVDTLLRTGIALGHDSYPFEARIAEQMTKNWFNDIQPTACEPTGHRSRTNVDPTTQAILQVCNSDAPATIRKIAQHMIASSHQAYLRATDIYKIINPNSDARFIVEKIGLAYEIDLLRCVFDDVRPIFVVRDPRDIMISMRKFNELNSSHEFEEAHSRNLSDLASKISNALKELTWRYDSAKGPRLIIRYEDLVVRQENVIEQIRSYVGAATLMKPNANSHKPSSAQLLRHVTSISPNYSMNRWHSILSETELELANWHFAPFLQRFGYQC